MVDFVQYPHVISMETETVITDPYQDDNGDWILPTPGDKVTITSEGRAVPNGKQNKIKGENGLLIEFDFLVYLPQDCLEFAEGQAIVVKSGADTIDQGVVQRFFRGQLNAMLWV